MAITPCMRKAGVSKKLLKTTEMLKCPKCKFQFNLMYSRAIACQGCRLSILGCDSVRCPKCDFEFSLNQSSLAIDEVSAKLLSFYMSKILSDYFKDFGEKPTR